MDAYLKSTGNREETLGACHVLPPIRCQNLLADEAFGYFLGGQGVQSSFGAGCDIPVGAVNPLYLFAAGGIAPTGRDKQ